MSSVKTPGSLSIRHHSPALPDMAPAGHAPRRTASLWRLVGCRGPRAQLRGRRFPARSPGAARPGPAHVASPRPFPGSLRAPSPAAQPTERASEDALARQSAGLETVDGETS